MAIPFKKVARKRPGVANSEIKFYPQLVTLGQSVNLDNLAFAMKEASSLSAGDIQSVLTNFVEAMRTALYNGQSVNIRNFGVFSLSARTVGTVAEKDCTAKSILAVKINFRPSTSVRPSLTATRAGDKLEFLDIKALTEAQTGEDGTDGGGSTGGGVIDPGA